MCYSTGGVSCVSEVTRSGNNGDVAADQMADLASEGVKLLLQLLCVLLVQLCCHGGCTQLLLQALLRLRRCSDMTCVHVESHNRSAAVTQARHAAYAASL